MPKQKYIVEMEYLAGDKQYEPDELLELLCATTGRDYDIKWYSVEAHAPATPAPYASYDEIRRRLKAIIGWLEKNQPDVFKRGLWDVIEVAEAAPTTPESAFRKGYLEREAGTQEKK